MGCILLSELIASQSVSLFVIFVLTTIKGKYLASYVVGVNGSTYHFLWNKQNTWYKYS